MPTYSRRTVAITGANGFIGSQLVEHFSRRGWNVFAFCRTARNPSSLSNVTFKEWSLPDGIRDGDFIGGDVLVHCAIVPYSRKQPNADEINTRGTEQLLSLARKLGYSKFVFLSSLSAHDGAESHYGRHKRQLERIFDPSRDLVIRPGLTLGNGGLARAIFDTIKSHRIVPLVGGGRQPVYTIAIDDLCNALETLIDRGHSGAFSLAAPEPVTMRELYEGMARKAGARSMLIPVPYLPVSILLKFAERFGIELPITTENLLGLKQLRTLDVRADLERLNIRPRPFRDTLESLDLS
jgi:nucleoside-diphosphate-sugar epimerase